jgi:hypothetical protein
MPTITVDQSKRGQSIATAGTLKGIRITAAPTAAGYNQPFQLVDQFASDQLARQAFCIIPGCSWISPVDSSVDMSTLLADGAIEFVGNLVAAQVPAGSAWAVEVE